MRIHTQEFKTNLKDMGRQFDSKITYGNIELKEELYRVNPVVESNLLKSVMKQLEIESSVDIPLGTVINYQLGVLVNGSYEYLNYGNYVVYDSQKIEDSDNYRIICYDKMIYAMKKNELFQTTYPVTIKNYLSNLATKIGLTLKDTPFKNQNLQIAGELYVGLEYTYRDILDEIAQATGSMIIINNNDALEVIYPTDTNDTIDEEYLKDTNVKFGQKYGPINSIVLSRAEADNVYLRDEESVLANGLCEVKIVDNQIMNGNNRSDFLEGILEALDGLEYYVNDFTSTGILYYEVGDLYNIKVGENTYKSLMLNDDIELTQGLTENIYTKILEQSETDYTKADKTDRKLNQTTFIVDKQNQQIQGIVSEIGDRSEKTTTITEDLDRIESRVGDIINYKEEVEGITQIVLEEVGQNSLIKLEIQGNITYENYLYPSENLFPSDDIFPNMEGSELA